MRRDVALVLLLLCGGCSSVRLDRGTAASPAFLLNPVPVRMRAYPNRPGVAHIANEPGCAHAVAALDLDPFLSNDMVWAQNVALHEVGHVLGCEHQGVKGNVMFAVQAPKDPPVRAFTRRELAEARMGSAGRVWQLELDPETPAALDVAIRYACERWNGALGRVVVEVESRGSR